MSSPLPAVVPLSTELRARTAAAHACAEDSPFLTALAGGRVTASGLAALLSRLAPVYEALEEATASWTGDPLVSRFVLPGLHRSARLRADLEHLTGCADVPLTPASGAYTARIRQVARTSSAAFLAHHYTRYLGDVSGGQVFGAAVERHLGAADGSGASFFAFPGLRPIAVKQHYRRCLDGLTLSADQREALVAEARVAYRLNVHLTAELDAELPRWTTAPA